MLFFLSLSLPPFSLLVQVVMHFFGGEATYESPCFLQRQKKNFLLWAAMMIHKVNKTSVWQGFEESTCVTTPVGQWPYQGHYFHWHHPGCLECVASG